MDAGAITCEPLPKWRGRTTLVILVLCAVLSYTDRQVLTLLVDALRRDLSIGDAQISLLLGGPFAVTYGTAGVVMGLIADRTNRRLLIILAVAGWSLATILCSMATSFGLMLAARLMVAFWEAALTPAALSLISDCFARQARGRAASIFIASIPLGGGLSIVISGLMIHLIASGVFSLGPLAHTAYWRLVLLAFGLIGLVISALALAISEPPRKEGTADRLANLGRMPESRGKGVRAVLAALWPILTAMAFLSLATNATAAWLPTVLTRQFGLAPADVGVTLGVVVAIFGVAGVLAGGWLGDRAAAKSGEAGRLRLCLTATVLAVPLSLYGVLPSAATVVAATGAFLFFTDVVTSGGLSAVVALAPNRLRATAVSIGFLLNVGLGAGLGAPAVPLVLHNVLPPGAPMGLALALVVSCALIGAAAALLARRAKPAAEQLSL